MDTYVYKYVNKILYVNVRFLCLLRLSYYTKIWLRKNKNDKIRLQMKNDVKIPTKENTKSDTDGTKRRVVF